MSRCIELEANFVCFGNHLEPRVLFLAGTRSLHSPQTRQKVMYIGLGVAGSLPITLHTIWKQSSPDLSYALCIRGEGGITDVRNGKGAFVKSVHQFQEDLQDL